MEAEERERIAERQERIDSVMQVIRLHPLPCDESMMICFGTGVLCLHGTSHDIRHENGCRDEREKR